MTSSRYCYGLDFGTSNTSVVLYDREARRIVDVPDLPASQPTLLYYAPQDRLLTPAVGDAAIDGYLLNGSRGRFFQAIKSVLGNKTFTHTRVNNINRTLEDLLVDIISFFKKQADAACGMNITSVVCGRPAVFVGGRDAEKIALTRLRTALERCGFSDIRFELEPIAAAYDYESTLTSPQTVLVGDFGGGTSDFTIMRLAPERFGQPNRSDDILATSGVPLAGNAFDSAIMRAQLLPAFGSRATYKTHKNATPLRASSYAHSALCRWEDIHGLTADKKIMEFISRMMTFSDDPDAFIRMDTLIRHNLGYQLFRCIESAKIALSDSPTSEIVFAHDEPPLEVSASLTAEGFAEIISDDVEEIFEGLDEVLKKAQLAADQIDAVFLTGGTAHTHSLQQAFSERFGSAKIHTGNFFTSVARGLALSALTQQA